MNTNNSDKIWQERENTYWPANTTSHSKNLEGGLYRYVETPESQWYLERTGKNYLFQYKIYGAEAKPILERVQKAWNNLENNLGILLNGLKGTGKTVTAQLIANWAVQQGIPVLNVRNPIPLATILEQVEQSMVVVFDEFEKTHHRKEHQQALLTALDGMARNGHRRLFIFTTNDKTVDSNFIDRPGRIRYLWEFDRLNDDIIEEILDDLLDSKYTCFRDNIIAYLNTRKVLSIDVVKTIINEVNIFGETPDSFEKVINLSEQSPCGFTVEEVNKNGKVINTIASCFTVSKAQAKVLRKYLLPAGQRSFMENIGRHGKTVEITASFTSLAIELVSPTEDPNEWICNMRIGLNDCWVKRFPKLQDRHYMHMLSVDEKPKFWKVPVWAEKIEAGEALSDIEMEQHNLWCSQENVYGGNKAKKFILKITPKFEYETFSYLNA
jgi:hypothetical protein